jgi:hypothetical protein
MGKTERKTGRDIFITEYQYLPLRKIFLFCSLWKAVWGWRHMFLVFLSGAKYDSENSGI